MLHFVAVPVIYLRSVSRDIVEFNPLKGHWNLTPLTPRKGLC
jgi:hypothetical protein